MSDPFRKVKAGDPFRISPEAYNGFVDASLDYKRRTANQGRTGSREFPSFQTVLVRNDTGAAQGRLAVLGINSPIIDPADNADEFKRRVALSCVAPAADTPEGKFVVLAEPLAVGAIGRAYAAGLCPAEVNVEDEDAEAYQYAEIADETTEGLLASPSGSASIIWKEDGVGLKPAIVRLGGAAGGRISWAKATTNWHNVTGNGSYVDCHPCEDAAGTNPDTGTTLRIYLPRSNGSDPNVVADQVIGYTSAAGESLVAATGHLDAAIGTIRMWTVNTGDPPPGWQDCDTWLGSVDMRGRFPVGKGDGDTVGDHGGTTEHCHALERDAYPPPPCGYVQIDEGTWQSMYLSTSVVDHQPPYCVLRFIERYDNSA